MRKLLDGALQGAAAGFAATVPMTMFMTLAHRELPPDQKRTLPPREITQKMVAAVGAEDEVSPVAMECLIAAGHFGYGAAAGAIYGVASECIPLPPVASGVAFGLGVWAASYLGWIPAAGILPSATRQPGGQNAVMIGAHIVWGAALGLFMDLLDRRRCDPSVV